MKPLFATLLLSTLAVLLLGAAPASAPLGQFRFERLNRDYSEVTPEILPVTDGAITIRLSSPRNNVTVRNHLLRLEPGSGGSHSADLRIEFSGQGVLVADVDMGGMGTRLQDQVVVPPQAANVQGRVRLQKVEGGYLVTPEQLPKRIGIRIQSGVGRQIVGFCDGLSAIPLTSFDCSGLERSLSRVVVPLPEPGEPFLLESSDLTAEERQRLDAYLGSAG